MTLDDIKRQAMEKSLGMVNSGLSNADLEMLYWESVINAEPPEPIDTSVFATNATVDNLITVVNSKASSTELATTNRNVTKLTARVAALEITP